MHSGICICDRRLFEEWWDKNKATVRATFQKCADQKEISVVDKRALQKIIAAETIQDLQNEIGYLSFKEDNLTLNLDGQQKLLPVIVIFYGSSLPILISVFENHIPHDVVIYRGETSNI